MERKTENKDRAVVLFGPTAVGKTALTKELFSSGYEIINADSIQVYKGLSIGSAKPDDALRREIPHHLVDIREPWEEYTSGDFSRDASSLIQDINKRHKVPLITGGTAFYFKMLMYKRSSAPKADLNVRDKVNALLEEKGPDYLYSVLKEVDHVSAERIYPQDTYRITRALEVYYQTGRPLSSFPLSDTLRDDVDFVIIGLERDRKEIEDRIALRVDEMFAMGLSDEIRSLIESGAKKEWPAMEAIGYMEWFFAIESGELSLRGIRDKIVSNSIKYAKRQMTFFKSFKETKWFHPDDRDDIKDYLLSALGDVDDAPQLIVR